jgi:DNA polymerase
MADPPSLFDEPAPDQIAGGSWADVAEQARGCRNCPLWEDATQTVFGEGPVPADVMLVGEQPGDQEDLQGKPFVGPAGHVLDEALQEAGIDREVVYVTNAVKHFKWTPRGKRRIHAKPAADEIGACRPWLDTEIEVVAPKVVACLGATAAQALLGPKFRVTKERGRLQRLELGARQPLVTATVHPSSILRTQGESREGEFAAFVVDLRIVADVLAGRRTA